MKRNKLLPLASAIGLSLCLAACSGGSGGTASTPAAATTPSPAAQEESGTDIQLVEDGILKVAMECAFATCPSPLETIPF